MTPKRAFVALAVAGVLVVGGCSSDPKKQIVGKWDAAADDGDLRALEFAADGGLKVYLRGDDDPVAGTYSLEDGKKLKVDVFKPLMARLDERVKGRGTTTIELPF